MKYIDANALLKAMDTWDKFGFSHSGEFVREPENDDYVPYVHYEDMVKCVKGMQTADVVEKFIEDITNRISERLIQFLEENYEIIPKKPAVRCKDCIHRHQTTCPFLIANAYKTSTDDDFCSRGERRIDVENEEVDLTKMRVNIEKTWNVLREAKRRDDNAKIH